MRAPRIDLYASMPELQKTLPDPGCRDVLRENSTAVAIEGLDMIEIDRAVRFCEDEQLSHCESQIVINACRWRNGNHGDGSVTALREIVRCAETLITISMEEK